MKFRPIVLLLAMPIVISAADYYKLTNVKRIEQNLYKADGSLLIETRMCLHLTIGEDAVLKWEGHVSMENKIIWDDDSFCAVKEIHKL